MSKVRVGFVTNSSSTSYIVIGCSDAYDQILLNEDKVLRLGKMGEYEFGWQNEEYDDVWSRINFAFLQSEDIKHHNPEKAKEWLNMIEEVILEQTGAKEIIWELTGDWCNAPEGMVDGYIDHQSSACEGENVEMFNSKEDLKRFLFATDSYIRCGNDNDGYDYWNDEY